MAGHNLGLLIWLDGTDTMEDVHQKHAVQPNSPLGKIVYYVQLNYPHMCVKLAYFMYMKGNLLIMGFVAD